MSSVVLQTSHIRALEVVHSLTEQNDQYRIEIKALKESKEQLKNKLDEHTKLHEYSNKEEGERIRLETELDNLRSVLEESRSAASRAQSELKVERKKYCDLEHQLQSLVLDHKSGKSQGEEKEKSLHREIKQLRAQLGVFKENLKEHKKILTERSKECAERKRKCNELEQEILGANESKEKAIQQAKKTDARLRTTEGQLRDATNSYSTHIQTLEENIQTLKDELKITLLRFQQMETDFTAVKAVETTLRSENQELNTKIAILEQKLLDSSKVENVSRKSKFREYVSLKSDNKRLSEELKTLKSQLIKRQHNNRKYR